MSGTGIDYYPLEITTAPLPLVGLLGKPEIHALVGTFNIFYSFF